MKAIDNCDKRHIPVRKDAVMLVETIYIGKKRAELPQLSAFLLSHAAIIHHCPHMLYHLKSGGVPMKTQELVLVYCYSKEEGTIAQIIQNSFEAFLRKELQNVENHLAPVV